MASSHDLLQARHVHTTRNARAHTHSIHIINSINMKEQAENAGEIIKYEKNE